MVSKRGRNFDIDDEDFKKFDAELNYGEIVQLQIQRILYAAMNPNFIGDDKYIRGIESLHCVLAPYRDKKYKRKLEVLKERAQTAAIQRERKQPNGNHDDLNLEYAEAKLELLMHLAKRGGFLPGEIIEA